MSDEAEQPECFTDKLVKARKSHLCCECGGWISAGETYRMFSGVWSGKPDRFRFCADCDKIKAQLVKVYSHFYEDFIFGDLCDWVFGTKNPTIIKAWLDNRTKRLVKNQQWMIDELNKLTNKTK